MSQRQERHALRLDDLGPEAVEPASPMDSAAPVEDDLPELDVDLGVDMAAFDSRPGEPVEAIAVLTGEDPFKGFSDDARRRYEMEISSFAADLRRQSLEHKRSHGGDNVSGRDVISAARLLRSHRPGGFLKHLGAIGGVLIGLGVQALAGSPGGVFWAAGTAVVGVVLLVWHVTRA